MLNDTLKPEDQLRMGNYATLLLKPTFVMAQLHTVNLPELIAVVQQMEEQKGVWQELQNSMLIESGIEEIYNLDTTELREYHGVWKKSIIELNSVMEASLYEDEIESKDNIVLFVQELNEFATLIRQLNLSRLYKTQIKLFFQRYNRYVPNLVNLS